MASRTRKRIGQGPEPGVVDYLPRLLEAIQNAVRDSAHLEACIEALCAVPGGMFRTVSVLQSRPLEPFLVIARFGRADLNDRAWIRWPLQRLFVMRRAAILDHPALAVQALALPMLHHGMRTIVLAPLERSPRSPEDDLLLSVLCAMSLEPEPLAADIQTIGTPEFLWIGKDEIAKNNVERVIASRGWRLRSYSVFKALTEEAERCAVPVVCVDATVPQPSHIMRALRAACGSRITIITVGRVIIPASELLVLVDQSLGIELNEKRTLELLKSGLRRSAAARMRETDAKVQNAKALIGAAAGMEELASEAARAVARFVDGFANIQLVDSSGFVSLGEYPAGGPLVASLLPNFFLETRALLKSNVDDEFFEFVTSEERARDRLRSLNLISGACVPLLDGERILGTLVAGSIKAALERNELEAVLQLAAQITSRAHVLLGRVSPEAYYNNRRWTHIKESGAEIRVYRSPESPFTARLTKIHSECSLLTLVPPELVEPIADLLAPLERCVDRPREALAALGALPGRMGFLVAILDYATSTITLATRKMAPPVLWNVPGPHGEFESRGDVSFGALTLNGSGCAYLGDTGCASCSNKSPGAVRAEVDRDQPQAILACITMHSPGDE